MRSTSHLLLPLLLVAAAGSAARAETISGTFWYRDTLPTGSMPPTDDRPLRGAYVEIWQKGPGSLAWGSNYSVHTDDNGHFSLEVPFTGYGTQTSLRIYALNRAVDVREKDVYSYTFYQQPGPPNTTVAKTSYAAGDLVDFQWVFVDPGAVMHYNIADVILRGLEYAEARRDPREWDTIGALTVHVSSSINSFTDVSSRVIHLDDDVGMEDVTVLHEYAHFLENEISSFQAWGAVHDGCTRAWDPPRYAWMEGFADYFGQVVPLIMPGLESDVRLAPETPSCASGPSRTDLEVYVAAALLDLVDGASSVEPNDQICNVQHVGEPNDVRIFQIVDHELEIGPNNPRLVDFSQAWINRGYDVPYAAFGAVAADLTSPYATVRYDTDTVAWNKAIWRPSTQQWWILGGMHGVDYWGLPGDVPVPADYDGDGFTDIGVWRPGDGTWYVIHSSSNTQRWTQWGMNGDIPVPGDYDGDGEDDYAVYRPGDMKLYVYADGCAAQTIWGRYVGPGSPVVGDFDGDGTDDLAMYKNDGTFSIWPVSTGGSATIGSLGSTIIGYWPPYVLYLFTTPVVGDFDGDGRADLGRFEYGSARWVIRFSGSGIMGAMSFGNGYDKPVPGDYNGDGITELATWTADNGAGLSYFHVLGQADQQWGYPGDTPVPAP
jgi:hypothetical protein